MKLNRLSRYLPFHFRRRKAPRKEVPFPAKERGIVKKRHQCPFCHRHIEGGELERNLFVCPDCSHHFQLTPWERIRFLIDPGSFQETEKGIASLNPIDFPGYDDKIRRMMNITGLDEAVITGIGSINGKKTALAVMSFQFMGGSMGSVVGEKIARIMLTGVGRNLPVIIFTASGGARMQEGIFSLMQMAKTSHAAARLEEAGIPLFIVLTDPTMGGVTASFAMLGDVTLAEPGALIGFAGPRVIEGTIKQKLPESFQRSEFLLKKGFIDLIVERKELRPTLSYLIETHSRGGIR
ncbi:MAG: acetyl-CoA carboxylase, carboxyltransferase subunit beta [Candidatus Euphemobacter frigidus]|nr:acetyl-CoA carboxylase, carboxyltransferase subunit beta [Candidatus Euphemobacter frigidus]MDP8276019.1 acetyl-CoA carboxylase, carboxyltransferase subunit beta [Candidatus Euphemobacter frigidus]